MNDQSPWNEEREQQLAALWEKRLPTREIAEELGTTRNAILGKAHRLGLDRRDGKDEPRQLPHHDKRSTFLNALKAAGNEDLEKPRFNFAAEDPAAEDEENPTPLPLEKLRQHHCRWAINDGGPFLFCCKRKGKGDKAYCPEHRELSRDPRSRKGGAK